MRKALPILVLAFVASAIDIAASWVLRHAKLGPVGAILVALSPLPGNIVLVGLVLRAIRKLDDFQKRIHFEAVTVAFLSTGVAVFVYGYLQKAHAVGSLNLSFIWSF